MKFVRPRKGQCCNILYHSLPFACIRAGTHLCIRAATAFVSFVRRSPSRAFHSLVFSSTARPSSPRHSHGRKAQLSLCCKCPTSHIHLEMNGNKKSVSQSTFAMTSALKVSSPMHGRHRSYCPVSCFAFVPRLCASPLCSSLCRPFILFRPICLAFFVRASHLSE